MKHRRVTTVALLLACLFLSVDAGTYVTALQTVKALSPTETLKRAIEAIRDKNAAAYKGVLSKQALGLLEKEAEGKKLPVEEVISAGFNDPSAFAPPNPVKTKDEKIDGDYAEVNFFDGVKWVRAHFVKENKVWKVDGFSAPRESFKP